MDDFQQVSLTTVIPTFRRPGLLRRAMSSVLAQEGVSLQLCIYDNDSQDETAAVVAELDRAHGHVRYHRHETNIGAIANFEFGLRDVRTPLFSILSDDDYLLPGFYARAAADLARHPEAMFWAGVTLNIDESGVIWDARVTKWAREGLYSPPEGLLSMLGGMTPTWTGIVFRREVIDSVGLPDQETMGLSDLDYMLRIAAKHPFYLQKIPVAAFNLNPDSFSATQPLSSFWPGWQKMFRNIAGNADIDPATRRQVLEKLREDARRMLFRRGANALADGRVDFARDAATALAGSYGRSFRPWLLRTIAWLCLRVPGAQGAYSRAYRLAEGGIVKSRAELQARFGHLVRTD